MNESTTFPTAPANTGLRTVSGKVKGYSILTCTIIPLMTLHAWRWRGLISQLPPRYFLSFFL
jgi:hypothetical protein